MSILRTNMAGAIALISIFCILGCGLFGGDKIENAVINADLAKQKLKVTEGPGSEWDFSRDQGRCFEVTESNYSGDTAKLTLSVASYFESEAVAGSIFTAFGKVVMNYKRDGKGWKLENAESKELIQQILSKDKFAKFTEISAPLCRSYRAIL